MTLCNSRSSVKVGIDLSEPFDTVRGFRQGNLFNLVMESVLRMAGVYRNGTIFQKSVQLLVYADDIDIIRRAKRDVNEGKTKSRRVFDAEICGSRRRGRRKDQIEEALSFGVTNWHRGAKSRGAWKDVLRQAEIRSNKLKIVN